MTIALAVSPAAESRVWGSCGYQMSQTLGHTSAFAGRTLKARPPSMGGDWGRGSLSCTLRSPGVAVIQGEQWSHQSCPDGHCGLRRALGLWPVLGWSPLEGHAPRLLDHSILALVKGPRKAGCPPLP